MNVKEGTRRLALLLGVAGAIRGGFRSYSELQTILEQRASHAKFAQLAASPVVQQARRSLEIACADGHTDNQCGDEKYVPMSEVNSGGIKTIYWNKNGSFGKIKYQVGEIDTEDSQHLFPTSEPSDWNDPLIALFPILGFFIPGAVRAIGWVGGGFVTSPK